MSWEHETTGWIKIKEGEEKEFIVMTITKKEPTVKIKAISGKAYYYEFETNLGTLTVNNLGLFNSLVETEVREGDRIKVKYVKKGTIGNPSKFKTEIITKAKIQNPLINEEPKENISKDTIFQGSISATNSEEPPLSEAPF